MGLGKTLQTISLIVDDLTEGREERIRMEDEALALGREPPPKTTLIVCPLSVVGNWVKQFQVGLQVSRHSGGSWLAADG